MTKTPVFAKLLLTLCCAALALPAAAQEAQPGEAWKLPEDSDLRRSLEAIERGFSNENLADLVGVFPRRDKVLLRWEDPGRHDGLLTGTQVILFMRELFLKFRTTSFKLQSGSMLPPGRLYHCMGRWSLTLSDGRKRKIELHFSLKQDAGVWTIRELRQTR